MLNFILLIHQLEKHDIMLMDYSQYETVDDMVAAGLITETVKKKVCKKDGCCGKKNEEEEEQPKKDPEKPEKKVNADKLPVIYADLKPKKNQCIFKHIIIFTNDRSNDNKTLKNLKDAIKSLDEKPELHVFVAAKLWAENDGAKITIDDGTEKMVIEKNSNLDTLVFSRLGVQGEDECEDAVKQLQDYGLLVLNPVRYSEIACNKYDSACLFEKAEIPQPRFCLMTKEDLYNEKAFKEAMIRVYPDYDFEDPDKNEDKDVVIKILDGHGGVGISVSSCKRLTAILQTIFAIDPERQLILQKKEEADGGDIRVHVLTLRDKQVILAAMKRVKLGGDFRSNVSLGAEAEPVKLTPEQEQIALKTATISKLPWCAVDIMPLVKGSNKEIGDNVVLEINASPGTDGITEVIGVNFINILLNELTDPSQFMLQDKTAGFIESVTLNFGSVLKDFLAKCDTGNSTQASTLEVGEYTESGDNISFNVDGKQVTFKKSKTMKAKAGEEIYERPVIIIPELQLGLRKVINVPVAIVKSRETKTTNMLLNRDVLSRLGYIINPGIAHILTTEMEKVKIL